MHLVYIDEVKYDPPNQPYYWLCGLAIPEANVKSAESALNALAESYFGTRVLGVDTEFHAQMIVQGKGPYSGQDLGQRIQLFERIADVIDQHSEIGRIQVRLDPFRIARPDYQRIAFMYMVERIDQLMSSRKSVALMIADHDREFANENVRNLSVYKATGTEFEFGREISHVVDTVHHTHSHHSRLIQLADHHVYSVCLCQNAPDRSPRRELVAYLRGLQNFVYATKYKFWPPDES